MYKFPSDPFESYLKHSGLHFAWYDGLIILTLCGRDDNDEISSKKIANKNPERKPDEPQWHSDSGLHDTENAFAVFSTTLLRFMIHNKFQHISAATVTYFYLTITYACTMELYSLVGYGATVQRETVKL